MNTPSHIAIIALTASTCGTMPCDAWADGSLAEEIKDALLDGKPILDVRYRLEGVSQKGFRDRADASTARVLAGYETGTFKHFSALIEIKDVMDAGAVHFNDGINGKTRYPSVIDPRDMGIQRIFLKYGGIPDTTVTAGRQTLAFDNQRFVGYSNFRQNSVTFDGAEIHNRTFSDIALDYAHFYRVNRTAGERSPTGSFHGSVDLLHAVYHALPQVDIAAYEYALNFNDAYARTLSSQTYGLRLSGRYDIMPGVGLLYAVEAARQQNADNNPDHYATSYSQFEPGIPYRSSMGCFSCLCRASPP